MNKREKDRALRLFGEKVQELCAEKEISLPTLAHMIETDHSWLWRIVNGQVDFRYSTILRIAEALEVDPSELTKQNT